jgi:uncharacterized repeat protein (TIGR03843 family)
MAAPAEVMGILHVLRDGDLNLEGQFMRGSNYTFFGRAELGSEMIPFVYKPVRGERPLWDFPTRTLAKREAAAYLISDELGWNLVPPTIYRRKGPLGAGSLQVFIPHEEDYHYFNFERRDIERLRPFVIFDIIVNNADRKGSHILKAEDGHLFGIDHGLCFHREDKLRTVIWDFAGDPLPQGMCADLENLLRKLQPGQDFHDRLRDYLQAGEIKALEGRILRLLSDGIFPRPPSSERPFPWPLV